MTKKALILRTCNKDLKSYNGFQWPEEGKIKAPDWDPAPSCGNGLHGLLWGEGNGGLLDWDEDAKWLVVEVNEDQVVDLEGKVKFPEGNVIFCGNQREATDFIIENGAQGKSVVGATATAGHNGTATAGRNGTATAGYNGTATAGRNGTATAGYNGTATAGHYGTAKAGHHGTATAGHEGTATAGHHGTATAGHHGTATVGLNGTATAGDHGTATAGDYGTATAGYDGTATAGDDGTATAGRYGTAKAGLNGTATAGYDGTATVGRYGKAKAGEKGILQIKKWDEGAGRYRMCAAYVGESGILPDIFYVLDDNGGFVRAAKKK